MRRLALLLIAALLLLGAVTLASAQTREFDLGWHTIDGGAGESAAGDRFALSGTIGQPDTQRLSNGAYALYGGLWGPASQGEYAIYLPLILR
jgi:hypothetical protein